MGKKGKKSKRQKQDEAEERSRQEDIARKQQEEERQRQQFLKQQRIEERQKRAGLRMKRKADENTRLGLETSQDNETVRMERDADLNKHQQEEFEWKKWKKHLLCDPLPDASCPPDLNSFVTSWSTPQLQHRVRSEDLLEEVKHIVSGCNEASRIAGGVQINICKAGQLRNTAFLREQRDTFSRLGSETMAQLDELVVGLLVHKMFHRIISETPEEEDKKVEVATEEVLFGVWASTMANAFRNKRIDFEDLKWQIELPKTLAMKAQMPLGCKAYYTKHDYFSFSENNGRLISYGGVYTITLLHLPPAITNIGNWTVRRVTDSTEKICLFDYAQGFDVDVAAPETAKCTVIIPETAFILPDIEPILGWWDDKGRRWWKTDFSDVSWDWKSRQLVFQTAHLKPVSLVLPRGIDFKYRKWLLTPSGVEKSTLQLEGERMTVELEIAGSDVILLAPKIDGFWGVSMKPYELVAKLRMFGINISPEDEDIPIMRMCKKSEELEEKAHSEISTIAACFQLTGSRWNRECGMYKIIFQLRSSSNIDDPEELENTDDPRWMRCLVGVGKCSLIKASESDSRLNLDPPDDDLSHVSLLRCIAPHQSNDVARDLKMASLKFQESVRRMLNLCRVFLG